MGRIMWTITKDSVDVICCQLYVIGETFFYLEIIEYKNGDQESRIFQNDKILTHLKRQTKGKITFEVLQNFCNNYLTNKVEYGKILLQG